ncbi:MAG: threonyl-tRNA synthetase [Miltoncostaeaceae bacterium]|nr:threonyl-tRNA synthetase [Miltoncostaeaceae bacterium]
MRLTLPDGSPLDLPDGATGHDAAAAIGPGLARAALALRVGGEVRDLARPLSDLEEGAVIEIVTAKSGDPYLYVLRHSAAHVLAEAVTTIVPGTKLGFGPPIEGGFYYDFDLPRPLTEADFPALEAQIARIAKARAPFQRSVMSVADARDYFAARDQPYKVDQVEELTRAGETEVSLYRQRDFVDLCIGPHLADTGRIGAVKLLSVAGAYWRGSEKNPMLTRVYGTAFPTRAELDAHLERLEQQRLRDHRKVGRELELFHFDDAGPGFPFFLPRGMVIVNEIQSALRGELAAMGYDEVRTPTILSEELWHRSGHWDHYHENMYFTEVDGQGFAVKPMNCPGACLIFRSRRRSYRELPLRLAEFGHVHRHELSGVLHGLFRVRAFTQDDAHVFCTPDHILEEVRAILDLTDRFYRRFGFREVELKLATRPEKAAGTPEMWDRAEAALREALGDRPYGLKEGDAAFYGPKIDFQVTDTMGRPWQLGTCQLDFYMPERFDLSYTTAEDREERPVMIHRAITGSLERFLGILIEDSGGDFPLWLAPVQARVLPVSDRHAEAAQRARAALAAAGLRAEVDARSESVGRRIRDGELQKVPYLLVVGDREAEAGTVSVRARHGGDGGVEPIEALIARLSEELARLPAE